MTTSRLETFADGVFAIAATLLVLDVYPGEARLARVLHAAGGSGGQVLQRNVGNGAKAVK